MNTLHPQNVLGLSRRTFLAHASAIATASLCGMPGTAAAEPPPEIQKIRLPHTGAICLAPQYVADELLRLEGFREVEYVDVPYTGGSGLTSGRADLTMDYAPALVWSLDAGHNVVALAAVHPGCYQVFTTGGAQSIRDLKGTRVAISGLGAGDHIFLASMLAYVGIDPKREIDWVVTGSVAQSMQYFEAGKAQAFLAFPPQPQRLRALKLGQVIVDGTHDRPWSQYVCCLVTGNREFVTKYPVATKRAIRAILKATDLCAQDPERAAQLLVKRGFEQRYEVVRKVLDEVPYRAWRTANPEDTLRFYALRLHEVGMIKSDPNKLVAQGADWRFFNQLKKELKV